MSSSNIKFLKIFSAGTASASLKGELHRFSTLGFFSSTPGALIHGLQPFRIWLRIRRENRLYSNFSGVIDTAETVSAVSLSLQVLFVPLKGKSSKNISMGNIPILYKYLKQKKVVGCLARPHFRQ
jgi:hypothetical protein